ncbi:hypothetical protein KAH55_00350 [bacterium]|nr:hypothetical protein [bacterium]
MNFSANFTEKMLQHRRLTVTVIVLLIVILLVLLNGMNWLFLHRLSADIDDEMGQRLQSVARVSAHLIEERYGFIRQDDFSTEAFRLKRLLNDIKNENELAAVFLIDENINVLADDNPGLTYPGKRGYLYADSIAINQALNGVVTASELHTIAAYHFKNGYAPVINDELEIVAVLVIEANTHFFENLQNYQRQLIFGGIGSLTILLVFAGFLFWLIGLLFESHKQARRSERLALMGQMTASMAHEIRNPLAIIKSTADVLKDIYNPADKPNELFDFIPMEIRRLNRLVNDFLDFARGVKLEFQTGYLADTVSRLIQDLQREHEGLQVAMLAEIAADLPALTFDPDAVYRALYNLAQNGIQAITDPPGKLVVLLRPKRIKKNVWQEIVITDTGCGISTDTDRIFEPFFTTKTKGTGLGLAITRQIIQKHGGSIVVESQPDQGTRITVLFPPGPDF